MLHEANAICAVPKLFVCKCMTLKMSHYLAVSNSTTIKNLQTFCLDLSLILAYSQDNRLSTPEGSFNFQCLTEVCYAKLVPKLRGAYNQCREVLRLCMWSSVVLRL